MNRIYTDMMGYKEERKRLAKKYGTSQSSAERLIKTEIARINADTQKEMLVAGEFTHFIFVAEPGACEICAPWTGKPFRLMNWKKALICTLCTLIVGVQAMDISN